MAETSTIEAPDAVVATSAVEAAEAAAEQTVVIPAAGLDDVDNLADTTVLDDVADTTEFSEDDTAGLDARIAVATAAAPRSAAPRGWQWGRRSRPPKPCLPTKARRP